MESFITEIPDIARQADREYTNITEITLNELVQAGGILIPSYINEDYKSLLSFIYSRKGENLKAISGFLSKYRLAESLCNIVRVDDTMSITTQQLFKQAQNPEDFIKIAQNKAAFTQLEAALNNQPSTQFITTNQAFYSYRTTDIHPYYNKGTVLYSIPHFLSVDPRRTGRLIVFTDLSDELFVFMLLNAASFGFVWYGIDKNYWMYEGKAVKDRADIIRARVQDLTARGVNVFTDLYN